VVPPGEPPDDAVPVRHQGELLGALSMQMPASDPMNPAKVKLAQDLAAQAGLVLRNVRLIEEVRESRRRIVSAQDERAKKIERDLHDGAQQQLVALAIKVNLAQSLASKDPDKAAVMMGQVKSELQESLETLRDLARGIYPPLLADQGLAAALEAQSRKAAVPTSVQGKDIGRYSQETESAAYFCCLEAMQNISKYANATHATIALSASEGELTFTVTDDGDGFDLTLTNYGTGMEGMADRVDAIGGRLDVESSPGVGTTVTGVLPIGAA
jgi:signal transduction histidine kinase